MKKSSNPELQNTMGFSPWAMELPDLLAQYNSDLKMGLTQKEIIKARIKFGPNLLIKEKKSNRFQIFIKQFMNTMTYMLLFAVLTSLFLNEYLDAIAIILILLLNSIVGYIQEAKAEEAIEALKNLSTPKARVLRGGKTHNIASSDILPGDILQLEAGDYIVADAYIIDSHQLQCDEAVLTGESMPVDKSAGVLPSDSTLSDRSNMLHAGTALTAGSAHALVVSIGMHTEIGKIADLLEKIKSEKTPLQLKLQKVSNNLLIAGLFIMVFVVIIGLIKGDNWVDIFMYSISLAIAAIPEGLPAIVTLALALAIRRMSKRNAIVRKMSAVETLGSTDIICTDKTGTLTTGNMRVRDVFVLNSDDEIKLKLAAVNCNNASLDNGGSGDPTEIALLLMAPEHLKLRRLYEWSFESVRKRMSVAVSDEGKNIIYCKGAPETTLPRCVLTKEDKDKIDQAIIEYSIKGSRVLAFATRESSNSENLNQLNSDDIEVNLKFLGLVALADPPKPESIIAINSCKQAGIKVVMITGDHPLTALAIARELGIVDDKMNDLVLSGSQLETLSQEVFKRKVEEVLVYARVTPAQKLKIVKALQANGHTVAMTGDGVNDAPALKKASIGISMGKGGTEVARQASSMILTDDNFATIVSAVEEGRAINGNIKRTIQYLLSTNIAELLIVLGSVLLGLPMPFVPLTLLWINLITDGMPSLALAAEPVEKNFLATSPKPSSESFFSGGFMKEMLFVGILMTIISLSVYAYVLKNAEQSVAQGYAFNLLVYLSLFRSLSCRSETKTYFQLKINPYHIVAVILPISLQLILENTLFFQNLFKISPLSLKEHLLLMLLGAIPVSLIEFNKLLRKKSYNIKSLT